MRAHPSRLIRCTVALRTEGVDRNTWALYADKSHSPVALRTEGVDRNISGYENFAQAGESPSARRAWIEIGVGLS